MTTTPKHRSDEDPAGLLDPDVVQVLRTAFAGIAEAPAGGVPTGAAHLVAVGGTGRPTRSPRPRRFTALLAAAGTGAVAAGVAGVLAFSGNALAPAPTTTAAATGTPTADPTTIAATTAATTAAATGTPTADPATTTAITGTPTADAFADVCEKRLAQGTGPKALPRYISHLVLAEKKALVAYAGKDNPGVVCVLRKRGEQWTALDVHVNPTEPMDDDERAKWEEDGDRRLDADGLGFVQFAGDVPRSVDTMAFETKRGETAPITVKDGRYLALLLMEPGKTMGKMWRVVAYSKGVRLDLDLGAVGTAEVSPEGVQQPIDGAEDFPVDGEESAENAEKSPEG